MQWDSTSQMSVPFYVEMDSGKFGGARVPRNCAKVQMYESYFLSGAWKALFPQFPDIIFITSTEKHRRPLQQAMMAVRKLSTLYWHFASRQRLWKSMMYFVRDTVHGNTWETTVGFLNVIQSFFRTS